MINNRQAGRRRGRGGQRSGGNPGRPESGNRIDNRARGNAAQLLEKYKNLARDAQTSGDRVMTEYYLQFADHYFRVLSDSRSRFEENRRQREDAEDEGDEEFGYEGEQGSPAGYGMQDEPRDREPRDREPRRDSREQGEGRREPRDYGEGRGPRRNEARQRDDRNRGERGDRREPMEPRANGRALDLDDPVGGMDAPAPAPSAPIAANDAPRRRGRPRRDAAAEQDGGGALDAAVLPPAIGAAPAAEAASDDAPRPARRRRVRSDDEAVPPAA